MFRTNASQFYKELIGRNKEDNISPDADEATNFGGISGVFHLAITMMLGGYKR